MTAGTSPNPSPIPYESWHAELKNHVERHGIQSWRIKWPKWRTISTGQWTILMVTKKRLQQLLDTIVPHFCHQHEQCDAESPCREPGYIPNSRDLQPPRIFTKNRTCALHYVIRNYVTGSGLGQHVFSLRMSDCSIINDNKLISVLIKN